MLHQVGISNYFIIGKCLLNSCFLCFSINSRHIFKKFCFPYFNKSRQPSFHRYLLISQTNKYYCVISLQYCTAEFGKMSVHYMEYLYNIWNVCSLYGTSACYMESLYNIWNVCILYGISVHYMECLYTLWNVCTLYGISLNYMEIVYAIWNVCTLHGMSVCYMKYLYTIWNVCTLYGISLHYMEFLYAT